MDRRSSKPLVPPHQRAVGAANAKSNLLSPDVLDDETRKLLLEEVRHPVARLPASAQSPRCLAPTSPAPSPRGRRVPVSTTAAVRSENEGGYPAQLRARVNSNASNDLVTSMAARLAELEQTQKKRESEMEELQKRCRVLSDRFQKEQKLREEAETLVVVLYEEKKEAEDELADMQRFLADYGLHWRGKEDASAARPSPRQATPLTKAKAKAKAKAEEVPSATAHPAPPATTTTAEAGEARFDLYEGDYAGIAPASSGHGSSPSASPTQQPAADKAPPPRLFSDGPVPATKGMAPTPTYSASSPPDVALLTKNARILSDYVGWKGVVVTEGKRAVIRDRDVVTVVVYKNGICVNKGVFRPYGWALCDAFLKDLVEGFYPYEFKDKYPDGFPIEVVDRSHELCAAGVAPGKGDGRATASPAPAATPSTSGGGAGGRRLGGPSPNQPANIHSLQDAAGDKGHAPLSKDEFLSRLPAQRVTPAGRLVNVRGGVAGLLAGGEARDAGPHTDVSATVHHISSAEAKWTAGSPGTPHAGDLVALLVRLPSGQKVTLRLPPTATIDVVRAELALAVPDFVRQNRYELCQAFPTPRVFDKRSATLADLGISKSCTMMVKLLKHS